MLALGALGCHVRKTMCKAMKLYSYPEEEELNPLAGPVGKLGGLGLRLCEYFGGEETEVGKETREPMRYTQWKD